MEFQGRVKKMMPIVEGVSSVGNPYRRLDFIFEFYWQPSDTFSQTLVFTVMNEKIDEFALVEGEEIFVDIEANVRPYNNKLFNNIWARNIRKAKVVEPQTPPAEQQPAEQMTADQKEAMEKLKNIGGQGDDMPF
jgi:hypothetical protein